MPLAVERDSLSWTNSVSTPKAAIVRRLKASQNEPRLSSCTTSCSSYRPGSGSPIGSMPSDASLIVRVSTHVMWTRDQPEVNRGDRSVLNNFGLNVCEPLRAFANVPRGWTGDR